MAGDACVAGGARAWLRGRRRMRGRPRTERGQRTTIGDNDQKKKRSPEVNGQSLTSQLALNIVENKGNYL